MQALQHLPIKRKLAVIILATSAAALLLACASFMVYDLISFRRFLPRELELKAEILGRSATASLQFDQAEFAQKELMALLQEDRTLRVAVIFDRGNRVFASYTPRGASGLRLPLDDYAPGHRFVARGLEVKRAVFDPETRELLGTVYLLSGLDELHRRMLRYLELALVVLGVALVLVAVLSSRLQRLISDPLLELAKTARSIADRKDYSVRARPHAGDEIGYLTAAFNQMLDQIQAQEAELQATHAEELAAQIQELRRQIEVRRKAEQEREAMHRQLQEISRQAGMAEVATGVLHNVGNVLNSVNVSATMVADRIRQSRVANVLRVVDLLRQHREDLAAFLGQDPRGQQIPTYLAQVAEHLEQERTELTEELSLLAKNIEHIKEIVSVQQNYAKVSGLVETLPIRGLVEDALQMTESGFERHSVQVIRQFQPVPPVRVDKHKVLQILLNLLRNAKYALKESAASPKTLHIRIFPGASGRVQIQVADNGVGIDPANLTRIFSHGFTTKRDGHGFGLHLGALTAREMGGQLTAHSEGHGRGATFTLEIPREPEPAPPQPTRTQAPEPALR